jgi:glycine/sarcosine N-methyltransferase
MYDSFSSDYDRFVNWPGRLAGEMPFIEARLGTLTPAPGKKTSILDVACGTGMHAIELAKRGWLAAGADLSIPMIERARNNAEREGVDVPFKAAGFGELAAAFADNGKGHVFDALICLGNSLPHLLTPLSLAGALDDFSACLRPGGMFILQNRNFDAVLSKHDRWMESQSSREGDAEWVFMRFYDFEPDGLINFNLITLSRTSSGGWSQKVDSTRLYPLLQSELQEALQTAGFREVTSYGGLDGAPFDAFKSGNLVMTAIRA